MFQCNLPPPNISKAVKLHRAGLDNSNTHWRWLHPLPTAILCFSPEFRYSACKHGMKFNQFEH